MVFKKGDPATIEAARKGGLASPQRFKKDSEYTREMALKAASRSRRTQDLNPEERSRIAKVAHAALVEKHPDHQRQAGRRSRVHENAVADRIREDYDHLFLPTEVCDRIGIKDGKIFFIEIKNGSGKGQKLKPRQELMQSFANESYVVIRE